MEILIYSNIRSLIFHYKWDRGDGGCYGDDFDKDERIFKLIFLNIP